MKWSRVIFFGIVAMVVASGMFYWLFFWYGDIMPDNPPPSFTEDAFRWVCVLVLFPGILAAPVFQLLGPIGLLLSVVFIGLVWGIIADYIYKTVSRFRPVRFTMFDPHFWKWALVQSCLCAVGCALWFYFRASYILSHPADPENYGNFGANWSFQTFAFFMSRLIPVFAGLCGLLALEFFVLHRNSAKKGSDDIKPA